MKLNNGRLWKSLLAGAAGGLAAAYAMNQFQAAWTAVETRLAGREGKQERSSEGGDDATVKTAKAISDQVFHHKLSESEKNGLGPPNITPLEPWLGQPTEFLPKQFPAPPADA